LSIALGSVSEIETQLIIAREIDYMTAEKLNHLLTTLDTIRKMFKSLAHRLK
jgi:four helix bundle protein